MTEFVPAPALFLLCDDRHCSIYLAKQVDMIPGVLPDLAREAAAFISDAQAAGWRIGLDEQMCPRHVAKEKAAQSMIEVPKLYLQN